jgi:hypothetical protein
MVDTIEVKWQGCALRSSFAGTSASNEIILLHHSQSHDLIAP